jgi:hypothetical protein
MASQPNRLRHEHSLVPATLLWESLASGRSEGGTGRLRIDVAAFKYRQAILDQRGISEWR